MAIKLLFALLITIRAKLIIEVLFMGCCGQCGGEKPQNQPANDVAEKDEDNKQADEE
jgi:hypothetical protein